MVKDDREAPYKHRQLRRPPLQPVLSDGWDSLTFIRRKQQTISAASFPAWQLGFPFYLPSVTDWTRINRQLSSDSLMPRRILLIIIVITHFSFLHYVIVIIIVITFFFLSPFELNFLSVQLLQ